MTTQTISVSTAAEHYMDGARRGREAGALDEKNRILDLLQDPDFQDAVAYEWKADRTIYETIIDLIIRSDKKEASYNKGKEELKLF